MPRLLDGKVAVITGAGRGLGREHALMLAEHGAKVLVNDLGANPDGSGADTGPAHEVADLIRGMGGDALVNGGNVAVFAEAGAMVQQAIDAWGRVDILDQQRRHPPRPDDLLHDGGGLGLRSINVHLKGHFCPTHHVAKHWRERAKSGETFGARLINTASPSGLYGNVGQSNYGAAKAGIAAFTTVCALELARYGVTANCLAPTAMTRLVMATMGGEDAVPEERKVERSPPGGSPPSSPGCAVTRRRTSLAGSSTCAAPGCRSPRAGMAAPSARTPVTRRRSAPSSPTSWPPPASTPTSSAATPKAPVARARGSDRICLTGFACCEIRQRPPG